MSQAATQEQPCRERGRGAIRPKLRRDMRLGPPSGAWAQAACPPGEPLRWLGCDGRAGEPGCGGGAGPELCRCGWAAARGPQPLAHPPEEHETWLGRRPLASRPAQQVLQQVRPWIAPAPSFENNQRGWSAVCCNRLRFPWARARLAEAAGLLRARARLGRPPTRQLQAGWMPPQLALELAAGPARPIHQSQT